MLTAEEYLNRLKTILQSPVKNNRIVIELHWNSITEARQLLVQIRHMQKEVTLLKKDLNLTMKLIRSSFTSQKATVQAGFLASLGGARVAGRTRALKREKLRQQQVSKVTPYEYINRLSDEALTRMDNLKIQIQEWIAHNPEVVTSARRSQQVVEPSQENRADMSCSKCGTSNPVGNRFCENCGTPLFEPPES